MEPDDVIIADIAGQALDIVLHGPESAHKNDIVKTFTHTSIFFSLSVSLLIIICDDVPSYIPCWLFFLFFF